MITPIHTLLQTDQEIWYILQRPENKWCKRVEIGIKMGYRIVFNPHDNYLVNTKEQYLKLEINNIFKSKLEEFKEKHKQKPVEHKSIFKKLLDRFTKNKDL